MNKIKKIGVLIVSLKMKADTYMHVQRNCHIKSLHNKANWQMTEKHTYELPCFGKSSLHSLLLEVLQATHAVFMSNMILSI